MSVSPKLDSTTTTTTTTATTATTTNSQLATLLSESCREVDSLRRDLTIAKKRAEKAERLLASFTQATTTSSSNQIQDSAARTILECESRVERAELARDEAESHKRLIADNWLQLERYLASLEAHCADARHGFSRIIAERSAQLALNPVPIIGQPSAHHAMPPPAHPSRHQINAARGSSLNHRGSQSLQAFPSNIPLPPLPNPNPYPQSRVRPRAGSLEGAGQPPAKKPRGDGRGKEGREDRAMYSESPIDLLQLSHNSTAQYPRSSPYSPQTQHAHLQSQHLYPHPRDPEREALTQQRARLTQSQPGVTRTGSHTQRRPKRAHSQTRSPSRSSSRSSASSLSVDEMLLQATGTDDADRRLNPNGIPNGSGSASGPSPPPTNRQLHASHPRHRTPGHAPPEAAFNHSNRLHADSPSPDYRSHSQQRPRSITGIMPPRHTSGTPVMSGPGVPAPAASDTAGPLPQPGQVQTYQTHVFAPVVTGAPVKKSKFMNSGSGTAASGGGTTGGPLLPTSSSEGIVNSTAAETPLQTSYPATNAQGQRICRQCGLPGRYKEGKCVEKWGPGPHGPGTVCDRCRKKMKRVERRGTADNQLALAHAMNPLAPRPLQTPTPFRAHAPAPVHRSDTLPAPRQLGPGGTHIISPHGSMHDAGTPYPAGKPRGHATWSPPPTIVTLGEDPVDGDSQRAPRGGMMGPASRGHSRSSSRNGRTPHRERASPPEAAVNGAGAAKRSPLGSDASSSGGRERARDVDAVGGRGEGDAEGEGDADAEAEADADADAEVDAEVDAEADADAEAELLEAVDAAEASSGSGGGTVWPKEDA